MIENANNRSVPRLTVLVTPMYTQRMIERLDELCPDTSFVRISQEGDVPEEGRDATVLLRCFMSKPQLRNALSQAPNVSWMHTCTAGFDQLLVPDIDSREIVVTRSAETTHIPISEWVLASVLYLAKDFGYLARAQARGEWGDPQPVELSGSMMLVIGAGAIGTQVAQRGRAFGMETVGLRRTPSPNEHFDVMAHSSALEEYLPKADFVIVSCPLTAETRGLIGEAQFKMMKSSAHLVNIARGAIVNEADMRQALIDGEIAGAVVDVFEEEPLPPESNLWDVPNLLITPHSSYRSPKAPERGLQEFAENLDRFRNGLPLRNQLQDSNLGY